MPKEVISEGQAISLIAIFIMGTTVTLGTAGQAKNDLWLSIIFAFTVSILFVLIYVKILSSFPGKDLFEISEMVFGQFFGKVITALYTWYALHLGALVIRNFGEFVNTVSLPETPMFVTLLIMGILSIWIVKSGIEVMGRSSKLFLLLDVCVIAVVYLLAIPQFELHFLKPVLGNGFLPVWQGALSSFSFPFAEIVILMGAIFALDKDGRLTRAYLKGISLAGFIILMLGIRNIVMLGANYLSIVYFPSYIAVSRIRIGEFLQRIEVSVDIVFLTAAFFKASLCLFVACKGIKKLFGLTDYRTIVLQTGLIMVYLSYFIYDNIMEMREWAFEIYTFYALPYQMILPIIILIGIWIKKKNIRKSLNSP